MGFRYITGPHNTYRSVGLHNQAHPRTDAVVIMAVVNPTNDKILLGRNVSPTALAEQQTVSDALSSEEMARQVLLNSSWVH